MPKDIINQERMMQLLKDIASDEIDPILDKLMEKFDQEIVPYEDEEDPARPSLCKAEFREFLRESIEENLKINGAVLEIGIGDADQLGFGDRLSEETTDCIKIIGTILHGIVGNYILITSDMIGDAEVGRFGEAYLLPVSQYRKESIARGWDPFKPKWKFSNFPGVPDFFEDIDFDSIVDKIVLRFSEAIGK